MCLSREKVTVLVIWSIFLTAVQVCSDEFLPDNTICKAQFTPEDHCEETLPTTATEQSMCDTDTTKEIADKNNATDIIPSSGSSTGDLLTFEFCERDVQSLNVTYYIKLIGNVSFYTWNKNANITDAKEGNKSKREDAAGPHEIVETASLLKSDNAYEINNVTYKAQHSRSSPVINLSVSDITSESMTLIWTLVAKKKSWVKRIFNITVNNNYTHSVDEEKCCYDGTNNCNYTIVNLTAFTQYVITVNVIESLDIYLNGSYERNSTSIGRSCWKTTEEKQPQKLENCNVEYFENEPSVALLRWSLPEAFYNSRCLTFNINGNGNSGNWQNLRIESRDNYFSTNITDLIPGNDYSSEVYANNTYNGRPCFIPITMPIYKPPQNFMEKINNYTETTTATVEIRQTEDTHKNGRIQSYKIIVSKLQGTHDVPATIPSWHQVQTIKSWSRYSIMISPELFKNTENRNFTIGNGTCYDKREDPCNGPLEPETKYLIFIRAYTDSVKYTDTTWWFIIQTQQDNTLLLAILGMVCALAVSVWVALLWWCGAFRYLLQNKKDISHNMHTRPPLNTTHPVQLAHFPKYVRTMLHDTPNMFTEEFRGLSQVGREQPCTAADLPCNRPKNRFTNILPYDHSRFKLQPVDDEEGSDYINANYVPGFHSQKDFIATQGPMMHTRNSFWRMCWESNACAIVMLTRCVEKSMEKCDHYWPYENQPTSYGDLYIATLSSKHHCNWTISELFISKGGEKRHVYHLQFIAWPDFGVPNPPSTLVQFVRVFREHCQPGRGGPAIVHCSAGVGRSGTFIALDRLMLQLHSRAEYLDVVGLVCSMRRARPLMVQTERQYVCIHACIASVLEAVEICRRRSTVIARPSAAAPPPTRHHSQQVHYNLAFEGPQAKTIHRDILLSR